MEYSELTGQLLNNSLVLENIFQFLSLKEHLKLIHICEEFRETIVQFIWRSRCKVLTVTERTDSYLLDLNETLGYSIKQLLFLEFLELNQFNVHKLQLKSCANIKLFRAVEQFENLTFLNMLYCEISEANMEEIAKNCTGLRALTMDRCMVPGCSLELVLDRDIKVETLAKMPALRELSVFNRYKVKMNYQAMLKIVQTLRLSKLSLSSAINHESPENNCGKLPAATCESFKSLEHLDIGRFSDRSSWSLFVKFHLSHFANLQTLKIFIDLANCVLINDDIVKTIGDSCPQLRELSFKQCKFQVDLMSLPPSLHLLCLEWCWGVTWHNFHQILLDYQLQTFVSINGHYGGNDVDYFYYSDCLTTLTLETSLIKDFVDILTSSKSQFPLVTSFNWLNSSESCHTHPQEIRQELSKMCPNLQELQLEQSYLSVKEFQRMACLQVLKFSLFDLMSWPYLLNMLQSSALTHLTIDMPANVTCSLCPILTRKPDLHLCTVPVALTKNLKFLEIPLQLLRNALDFWLDFLHKSTELKLKFYDCYSHEMLNMNFLQFLLNNEKFPPALKSINICNNNVDCNGLRKVFTKTMDRYEFSCNSKGQYSIVI